MDQSKQYDDILQYCTKLCEEGIAKGVLWKPEIDSMYTDLEVGREEYALRSGIVQRGFYCPSPVREHIITNRRRGRIAKRLTKASRPTNRYLFDQKNRLRIAETFYDNGAEETEYIFYEDNFVYGFVLGRNKKFSKVSIERFLDGKISEYLWSHVQYEAETESYNLSTCIYEVYSYDDNRLTLDNYYIRDGGPYFVPRIRVQRMNCLFDLGEDGTYSFAK